MATLRVEPPSPTSSSLSPSPNTAVEAPISPLTSTILRATGTIADLSRTLSELSSPEYRPSEDIERADVVCCCRDVECPASRAWSAAERKLEVSAEVGQALLERHEAFTRRHEAIIKQNESQAEHIATLNRTNASLQDQLANHTRVQKHLAQAQLNLDAADTTNRTLTKELQDARASVARLSAAHARGVGLDEKLRVAIEERDDLKREANEAASKAKMWETRANEAGSKCRKLQAEITQLREETDSIKLSRSEISNNILEDARARLQMLQNSLGHVPITSDDPEITRVLEALVADNEALKRDAAELQNMLTESREDARALQEEMTEMRARGEGGQEPLGEDVTDMSFTRSTPPPYNTVNQGHGRRPSWASARSGWAASFAASSHSPRAASFSGNAARITSPPNARRVTSPRGVPPLVIPPMRRRVMKTRNSDDGAVPALGLTRATGDDVDTDTQSIGSAMTSPRPLTLVPPTKKYRRTSAENSATSDRHSPIPSVNEVDDPEDETRVEFTSHADDSTSIAASDMNGSIIVANVPESPEKPKQRRPLMLLSRSRGVQTDDPVPPIMTHSHSHTPIPVPSPRPGSLSLTTSDTPSSPIIGPSLPLNAEHLAALLSRLQHSDVRGLSARLKRQGLVGADLGHLSRTTLRGISNDVKTELGNMRGSLARTIRDMLGEIVTLRGVVNDVVLDPAAAARVREEAFAGTPMATIEENAGLGSVVERGRQRLLKGQSSAMGWIAAPISKLWGSAAEGGQDDAGLAGGKKRLAPRVAPAIATSTTTVNVEFASTGTRRAVSTMVVAPDTIAPPPLPPLAEPAIGRERSRGPGDRDLRKEQLRGIFAGSQLAKDRERERVESWVILPSVNPRKPARAIRVDAGDATIRARNLAPDPHRLSRNVDAVIDAHQGQEQLLERALRPRGLSDSSIRSTFISHGEATRRMLSQVGAVEIASSSPYDHRTEPVITAPPPPTAIPKSGNEPSFHAPSIAYASTSASASTSTSPARAIPARRPATASSVVTESMPGSLVAGGRFPRRGSAWAGVLSDEEDSFQVGSFKEGVSFSGGSVVRHRDRASGRGVSERIH
ncbi:hypothetical protein FRC07_002836 [Ceratobasidium sp. 392]|nr:hypothetical protein FRC07_002836 [Ceratobasidium sp. 392]